jgi:hypothetical protein
MRLPLWRHAFQRRVTRQRLIAGTMALALVVGVFTTGTLFSHPAAAAPGRQNTTTVPMLAQDGTTPRLEVFTTAGGSVYHKWSDDHGATWSSWVRLASAPSSPSVPYAFSGAPAVVSDGPGRLTVFATAMQNISGGDGLEYLYYSTTTDDSSWSSWRPVPGTNSLGTGVELTSFNPFTDVSFTSDPAVASWGPGRMDLFLYGESAAGQEVLLHTWENNSAWSGSWEALGALPEVQGDPAAVSWGPGRVDVFGWDWGSDNELEHLVYDQNHGGWQPFAESLGGNLGSTPAVTSPGSGLLNVVIRNGSSWVFNEIAFNGSSWGGWSGTTTSIPIRGSDITNGVAVASSAASTMNVFFIGDDTALRTRVVDLSTGTWGAEQAVDQTFDFMDVVAAMWTPPPPPPPPTATPTRPPTATPVWDPPTPTPSGRCGRAGQPPCILPK